MNNNLILLSRILLSLLFLYSGWGKLAQPDQIAPMLAHMGLPAPVVLTQLMGLGEFVGGVAVIVGFQTRIIGYLLAAWCVLTGFMIHGISDPISLLKNLGLAGAFLLLAVNGPGTLAWYGNWPERGRRS